MTSKLRNYEDRVNKNRFDEAGLIYAGNFQFKKSWIYFFFGHSASLLSILNLTSPSPVPIQT